MPKTQFILSIFFILVALLEFMQDYLDAILNKGTFQILESLVYKVLWMLFIPIIWSYSIILKGIHTRIKGINYKITVLFITPATGIFHLLLFVFILLGVSQFIHTDPWSLNMLVNEKLTSRLYIVLSVYLLFTLYYIWFSGKKKDNDTESQHYLKFIPVKMGHKSLVVRTSDIKWINSEGRYISLHTEKRRYVLVKSLKELMQALNPGQFRRIHKSTIVNLSLVAELKSRLNGDYDVILTDGTILRLSRNYVHSIKGILL